MGQPAFLAAKPPFWAGHGAAKAEGKKATEVEGSPRLRNGAGKKASR